MGGVGERGDINSTTTQPSFSKETEENKETTKKRREQTKNKGKKKENKEKKRKKQNKLRRIIETSLAVFSFFALKRKRKRSKRSK